MLIPNRNLGRERSPDAVIGSGDGDATGTLFSSVDLPARRIGCETPEPVDDTDRTAVASRAPLPVLPVAVDPSG